MARKGVLMKYEKAIALIKDYEKCRLKAYQCSAGVWTIGWGTTVYPNNERVKEGDTCSQLEADFYFEHAFQKFDFADETQFNVSNYYG
jgi:lysozyme